MLFKLFRKNTDHCDLHIRYCLCRMTLLFTLGSAPALYNPCLLPSFAAVSVYSHLCFVLLCLCIPLFRSRPYGVWHVRAHCKSLLRVLQSRGSLAHQSFKFVYFSGLTAACAQTSGMDVGHTVGLAQNSSCDRSASSNAYCLHTIS